MHGRQLGALIGAIGGLAFVLVNAGQLPGAVSWLVRLLGLLAFLFTLRQLPHWRAGTQSRPAARAWRLYQVSVLLMLLALPLGARGLTAAGWPDLIILWVIAVVGAHFYPFAGAFHAPVFRRLAGALVAVALLGTVGWALPWPLAPAVAAVVAGFVLLAFSAGWPISARTGGPER